MAQSNRLPWALALIVFSLFLYFWGLGRASVFKPPPESPR